MSTDKEKENAKELLKSMLGGKKYEELGEYERETYDRAAWLLLPRLFPEIKFSDMPWLSSLCDEYISSDDDCEKCGTHLWHRHGMWECPRCQIKYKPDPFGRRFETKYGIYRKGLVRADVPDAATFAGQGLRKFLIVLFIFICIVAVALLKLVFHIF